MPSITRPIWRPMTREEKERKKRNGKRKRVKVKLKETEEVRNKSVEN